MCDFPEFTLQETATNLAYWAGFNFTFWLMGAIAFLWVTQRFYRGLQADRYYFPSVWLRLVIETVLLMGATLAAWISYSCKNWNDSEGVAVHAVYLAWLFTFALQITSLFGPTWLWVAALVTAISAVLSLVNMILCIVFTFQLFSVIIYGAITLYLVIMAGMLIVATVWTKGIADRIRSYADFWYEGVMNCTSWCVYSSVSSVTGGGSMPQGEDPPTSASDVPSILTDTDSNGPSDEDVPPPPLPRDGPVNKRYQAVSSFDRTAVMLDLNH